MTYVHANDKDIRRLIKIARKQGWAVTLTGKGHIKWCSPNGATLFSPSTGSYRSWMNLRQMLFKAGLPQAKKGHKL